MRTLVEGADFEAGNLDPSFQKFRGLQVSLDFELGIFFLRSRTAASLVIHPAPSPGGHETEVPVELCFPVEIDSSNIGSYHDFMTSRVVPIPCFSPVIRWGEILSTVII